MVKGKDTDGMVSDTGNWNVADSYTKIKIMKPIALCDIYEDVAAFGSESIIEELVGFQSPPNDYIRFTGLKRLVSELIKLINNAKFALAAGGTKKTALELKKHLLKIKKSLPNLFIVSRDETTNSSTFSIKNYGAFEDVLNLVIKIKSKINEPLNKNHLIFTPTDEFDPKAFKDAIKRRMRTQG